MGTRWCLALHSPPSTLQVERQKDSMVWSLGKRASTCSFCLFPGEDMTTCWYVMCVSTITALHCARRWHAQGIGTRRARARARHGHAQGMGTRKTWACAGHGHAQGTGMRMARARARHRHAQGTGTRKARARARQPRAQGSGRRAHRPLNRGRVCLLSCLWSDPLPSGSNTTERTRFWLNATFRVVRVSWEHLTWA